MMKYYRSGFRIDLGQLRQWWNDIQPQLPLFEQKREEGFRFVRIHRPSFGASSIENLNPKQSLSESIERRQVLIDGREMCRTDFAELSPRLCIGYCRTILNAFPESYYSCVIGLSKKFKYPTHVDTPAGSYRMHVVIETTPDAGFDMDGEQFNLPADGYVYMLATGTYEHTAWNHSDAERLHLTWEMPADTYGKYRRRLKKI